MAWGIGGWLLTPFLQKIGFEAAQKLRERVAAEIKTTFASTYTKEVSLAEALRARGDRRLQQARDRREIPDQPEQGALGRDDAQQTVIGGLVKYTRRSYPGREFDRRSPRRAAPEGIGSLHREGWCFGGARDHRIQSLRLRTPLSSPAATPSR